jgi:hypothetical protein
MGHTSWDDYKRKRPVDPAKARQAALDLQRDLDYHRDHCHNDVCQSGCAWYEYEED